MWNIVHRHFREWFLWQYIELIAMKMIEKKLQLPRIVPAASSSSLIRPNREEYCCENVCECKRDFSAFLRFHLIWSWLHTFPATFDTEKKRTNGIRNGTQFFFFYSANWILVHFYCGKWIYRIKRVFFQCNFHFFLHFIGIYDFFLVGIRWNFRLKCECQ